MFNIDFRVPGSGMLLQTSCPVSATEHAKILKIRQMAKKRKVKILQ
jgi:hypothetical protein